MNKYHAKRTVVDGIAFHSKGEARRWQELKLLQRGGEISNLQRQKRYPLHVGVDHICDYVSDFEYADKHGLLVVEDFKGVRTAEYRIKAKLMRAIYGITILETGKRARVA